MVKKIVLTLLITTCIAASYANTPDDRIPIENGKVVFSSQGNFAEGKEDIRQEYIHWLKDSMQVKEEEIRISDQDQGIIAVRIKDILPIEKGDWKTFELGVRYQLIFSYKENQYTLKITNLSYSEIEDGDVITYPAEFILIQKKYKRLSVKNASEKITQKTVEYVDNIFEQINELF